ncbi:hypothetical protein RRG08_058653 [Elysia crispata]|uniref:Uncharacterized protein n=1 Tax=Elysia crispata TaxID=231223 RepID=A0AAE0Z0X2_9GAST|nr:hypothetical protein RRG08_058653 [Elysia crispata]
MAEASEQDQMTERSERGEVWLERMCWDESMTVDRFCLPYNSPLSGEILGQEISGPARSRRSITRLPCVT